MKNLPPVRAGLRRAHAQVVEDVLGSACRVDVAPFQVHVAVANKDAAALEAGQKLVEDLDAAGIEVLFDDRPKVSPGVKFKVIVA